MKTISECWAISNVMGDTRIVETDGYGQTLGLVCRMPDEKDWPGSHRRAPLIASAPDLLAACQRALCDLELAHGGRETLTVKQLREAITLATKGTA